MALGGADVNETNTEGESLLQQSINQNNHEASSFLIVSGGADVNLRYLIFKLLPILSSEAMLILMQKNLMDKKHHIDF